MRVCVCVCVRARGHASHKETNLCVIFHHFAIKIISLVRVSILYICRCVLKKLQKVNLALSCLSVSLSSWSDSTPTRQIFMKVYIEDFSKLHQENSSFVKPDKNNGYLT